MLCRKYSGWVDNRQYVDGIKQKIEGLMQYYIKGGAGLLTAIKSNSQSLVECEDKKKDLLALISRAHECFKDNYHFYDAGESTVIVDKYSAPLLVLNRLVPRFNSAVDNFIAAPSETSLSNVETMVDIVSIMGNAFRTRLIELQNSIRSFNGYKNYSVGAIDCNGNGWNDVL